MAARSVVAKQFLALIEPLKISIERFAQLQAWSKHQAGDIVQEAVMTAWREFHRFELGTDFRAWIFRILINTVYSFNKKSNRARKLSSNVPVEDVDAVMERENAWASVLQSPEKVFDSLDERLVSALQALSIDEKQCLLLRILEGLSYKEIATLLEMPMGTVMSHVHRARLKLRERLTDMAVELNLVGGAF